MRRSMRRAASASWRVSRTSSRLGVGSPLGDLIAEDRPLGLAPVRDVRHPVVEVRRAAVGDGHTAQSHPATTLDFGERLPAFHRVRSSLRLDLSDRAGRNRPRCHRNGGSRVEHGAQITSADFSRQDFVCARQMRASRERGRLRPVIIAELSRPVHFVDESRGYSFDTPCEPASHRSILSAVDECGQVDNLCATQGAPRSASRI